MDRHDRLNPGQKQEKDNEIWNHERDIVRGGRLPMDESSRKKMISDARGLSDRFGSGSRGSFL